jgi:hypothetical protein
LPALRQSCLEAHRRPSASSFEYASPVRAAYRACSSAVSRSRCCTTPPSSVIFRCFRSFLWNTPCISQAPGFAGQFLPQRYVVGSFRSRHLSQIGCFSRPSSMSDGSRAQPMQARLSATGKGVVLLLAAGGGAAAALAASLSAFSAFSASRTSLVAAPRSGCCSRSLASSGLTPRSGSATRSPRTASRRASGVHGSHI